MEYNIKNITELCSLTEIRNDDKFLIGRDKDTYYSTFSTTFGNLSSFIAALAKSTLSSPYTDISQMSGDIQSMANEFHAHLIDAYVAKQIILKAQDESLQRVYPVGSLFITTKSGDPRDILPWTNSQWRKISEGKCLMGADTDHAISSQTEAKIPLPEFTVANNMKVETGGSHTHSYKSTGVGDAAQDGYGQPVVAYPAMESLTGGEHSHKITGNITVSVKESNGYDKNATKLQPPAFFVNIWERIG